MLGGFLVKIQHGNTRLFLLRHFHVISSCHKSQRMVQQQLIRLLPHLQQFSSNREQKIKIPSIDEPPIKKYLLEFLENTENRRSSRNVHDLLEQRELVMANISSLNDLKQDKEMKELAEEEQLSYQNELDNLDTEILKLIIPRNAHEDYSDIAVEISSGAGGQEAMLFANELLQLYQNYAMFRGWDFFLEYIDKADFGGIRNASFFISGSSSYHYFQNEIGVHRVQRVPVTSKGIIHTSTAAVVVMPQPTEVDIKISEKDLIIESMRPSGPGGQNVNKSESAVRVKHIPSGLVTECQEGKTQHYNKEIAIKKIRTKLFDMEIQKQGQERSAKRKSQIGNRERSAKIRTYNIPQNRITDHRAQVTAHNVKEFMLGGDHFHKFLEKLSKENELLEINNFLDNIRQSFQNKSC